MGFIIIVIVKLNKKRRCGYEKDGVDNGTDCPAFRVIGLGDTGYGWGKG
jgi:hypothetical protein